ncbi:MAG: ATP-grasp domain-containing protein [Candidatus Odinarchaeota archaeon]
MDYSEYKLMIIRTPPPLRFKDMPILLLTLIEEAEEQGLKVIPSSESLRKCDKLTLYSLIKKREPSVKIAPTILTSNENEIKRFIDYHKTVVCKPLIGGGGRGVFKIKAGSMKLIKNRLKTDGYVLIQKFIENLGYDIRTVIIGEDVVSQYARMNAKDFRYNIHLGGISCSRSDFIANNPSASRFFKESENIAKKIKTVLGLEMCGVDTLPGADGETYFLEANPFFGFKGAFEKVGDKIADYLCRVEKTYFR